LFTGNDLDRDGLGERQDFNDRGAAQAVLRLMSIPRKPSPMGTRGE
jgi:hypothetical protein